MSDPDHPFWNWLQMTTIITAVLFVFLYWDASKFDDTEVKTMGKFFTTVMAGGAAKIGYEKWVKRESQKNAGE